MITLDDVLPRLQGARHCGRGWIAKCPAHRDRRPSLKVDTGVDGRALLHCFASCSYHEIVRALNLEPAPRGDNNGGARVVDVHTLALRIARSQPWAGEEVALDYEIARAIRRRRRAVDVARHAATRAGDCDAAWSLLAKAARLDIEADAIEAQLLEAR